MVWCGVETLCAKRVRLVSSRGHSDCVRIVVSCDPESGLCMCLCLCFFDCVSLDFFIYIYMFI